MPIAFSLQVSTRKIRSASSFESINRAASLFIAWMNTRVDLQEKIDRKGSQHYYIHLRSR